MRYATTAFSLLFILLSVPSSWAAFFERDLVSEGDGLLVYDAVSGLEWLDVKETRGITYQNLYLSPYVTDHGFRLATPEEYIAFVFHAETVPNEPTPISKPLSGIF